MSRILLFIFVLFFSTTTFGQDKSLLQKTIEHASKKGVKSYSLFQKKVVPSTNRFENKITDVVFLELDQAVLNEIRKTKSNVIRFSIPLEDGTLQEITLQKNTFLNPDFKVYTLSENKKSEVNYTHGIYYTGVLSETKNTLAAFSFFENEISGFFTNEKGENYNLAIDKNASENSKRYILYRDNNILDKFITPHCDADDAFEELANEKQTNNTERQTYSNCKNVSVSVYTDFHLYQKKNNSIAEVANYITTVYNILSAIYRNEGIITSIADITISTAPDDYYSLSTSTQMLNTFSNNVRDNFNGSIAHLISGTPANIGGLAWREVLCRTSYPFTSNNINYYFARTAFSNVYAPSSIPDFPVYSWDLQVLSHEMGHCLGSRHTHNCTWVGGALDNCYTTEGGCPPGPTPINGGTIMSYCYLNSNGVNFNNGFGSQPGDYIRSKVASASCLSNYIPNQTLEVSTERMANRSCFDGVWTEYFYDNNTIDTADDELLLSINTNSQNIGSLDDSNFIVKVVETSGFGSNSAQNITAPYTTGAHDWFVAHRYWQIVPTTQPTNPVGIRFPFSGQDFNDLQGSVTGLTSTAQLRFFAFNGNAVANPDINHDNATSTDVTFYRNSITPLSNTWQLGNNGSQQYAEMSIENGIFSGGFGISNFLLGQNENTISDFYIYPNPTKGRFTIQSGNQYINSIEIYDVTSKKVFEQYNRPNTLNPEITIPHFQKGMYFVRVYSQEKSAISKLIIE